MTRELYQSFSTLLDYPGDALVETARRGASYAAFAPQVAEALNAFADGVCELGIERLQELYTATFDLQPLCAPYVGWQLLGEDSRRGRFLMKLQALYRQNGLVVEPEMVDHLVSVLAFLATAPDSRERDALVADGLIPALEKMSTAFPEGENPYSRLLRALRSCLESSAASATLSPKEVAHA